MTDAMITIIMGSESDMKIAEKAQKVLTDFEIPYTTEVASAHRTPDKLKDIINNSDSEVFIAIAGLSAALPGVIASQTTKPVIGVPVNVKLDGLDALLSIMQMPPKIPVATVGIDRGDNAAYLALSILSLSHPEIKQKLEDFRKTLAEA